MRTPEIPIITIRPVGSVHKPTHEDPESGISHAIQTIGKLTMKGAHHELVAVPPSLPHTPKNEDHSVEWVVRRLASGHIEPWDQQTSWRNFMEDSELLNGITAHATRIRQERPGVRVYMFMGFKLAGPEVDISLVAPRTMQSQKRAHIHVNGEIVLEETEHRFPDLADNGDQRALVVSSNAAGEASIKVHERQLRDFGNRFIFQQPVGRQFEHTIERTMFGFPSLQDALFASAVLRAEVAEEWLAHAVSIAQHVEVLPGLVLRQMQGCAPSVSIMFPNDQDRKVGLVDNPDPVWAMPFAVCSPHSALTPGGVAIRYETQAQ